MAIDSIPMTIFGKRKLEDELKLLITVERPSVIKAIAVARANGDLSENADYAAAKERQSFIEGRILEINGMIALAQVIDPTTLSGDKIVFGATVTLNDLDHDKQVTYQIVGADESNLKFNKISINAPLARALIGKKAGDEVAFKAPKGDTTYEVLNVVFK